MIDNTLTFSTLHAGDQSARCEEQPPVGFVWWLWNVYLTSVEMFTPAGPPPADQFADTQNVLFVSPKDVPGLAFDATTGIGGAVIRLPQLPGGVVLSHPILMRPEDHIYLFAADILAGDILTVRVQYEEEPYP